MRRHHLISALALIAALVATTKVQADWFIRFNQDTFTVNDTFNDIRIFDFEIRLAGDPVAGVYANPELVGVDYRVFGVLPTTTPSGFPAFDLRRPQADGAKLSGAEFYGQGSSLNFEIAAGVDATDGIQFSELAGGTDPIFTFDGREVDTGRYHPPIITLNADGTGLFQNSNNMGGINPGNGLEVDVEYGEEYISELVFDPTTLQIGAVPEPSSILLLGLGFGYVALRRRRS
jgi:hypothetical protein